MRYLFFISFLLLPLSLFGQETYNVNGMVCGDEGKGVEYATVSFADSVSGHVMGAVSDSCGHFSVIVPEGRYRVTFSAIGYETCSMAAIVDKDINMGTVTISERQNALQDVVVTARRPRVVFEADRYKIDIKNSAAATANTAESLMNQMPGVRMTDSGEIYINGISGAKVYVNDKKMDMDGESLKRYLATIHSEDIDRIEVIPIPPAEYSAEGQGGIIRIIKRRSYGRGYEGTAQVKGFLLNYHAVAPYVAFRYSTEKSSLDISANTLTGREWLYVDSRTHDTKNSITYDTPHARDKIDDRNHSVAANWYFTPNAHHSLALGASYSYWRKDEAVESVTHLTGADNVRTETQHDESQRSDYLDLTLNYALALDNEGKRKLSVIADYSRCFRYDDVNKYIYQNYAQDTSTPAMERKTEEQSRPSTIITAETSYTHGIGQHVKLMAGARYSLSSLHSDLASYKADSEGVWTQDESAGYRLRYEETSYALYTKCSADMGRWNISAGLRGEYSDIDMAEGVEPYSKLYLFPSFYSSYKATDRAAVSCTYARRIERVSYNLLMPTQYYMSRYTIYTGNPKLRPNIVNEMSLGSVIGNKYSLTLSYIWSDNAISEYNYPSRIGSDIVTVHTAVDGTKRKALSLNAYIPVTLTRWWNMICQGGLLYSDFSADNAVYPNALSGNFFTQHSFSLGRNTSVEMSYSFSSAVKNAYSRSNAYHYTYIALLQHLAKRRVSLKIQCYNLLCHQKSKSRTTTDGIVTDISRYNKSCPQLNITLTYNISRGYKHDKQSIKHSNNEENARR